MNKITTYFPKLVELAHHLDKANVNGSKPCLTALPKEPTPETWEAHQLIARSAAKFSYDKTICADLLDLQYKFYKYSKLNDITPNVILTHSEIKSKGAAFAIKQEKERLALAKKNEEQRQKEEEARGF